MMMMNKIKFVQSFFLLTASTAFGQTVNQARFEKVVEKMERHVLDYRDFMERLYLEKRCDETSLAECQGENYDECLTALKNPTCPTGPGFAIPVCGLGESCSGYVDFTTSIYRISPSVKETDPLVLESICFSRFMDEWLIQRTETDSEFWKDIGVEPRAMYFGSSTGAFRIFPGRSSEKCGIYDTTVRPWYVAGSSGPKNIVMVLDKSGSMEGARMSLMQQAAERVIGTLTVGDRVAIVAFDETARIIADEDMFLYSATAVNKKILIDAINELDAGLHTNIYDGLDKAFDVLDNSIEHYKKQEFDINCNSAILFLTDGNMTHPEGIDPSHVIDLVKRRLNVTSTAIGKPVLLFTYSVVEEEEVNLFPKELACSTEFGSWSRIDSAGKIVEALSSYSLLFALGLGIAENLNFTAWVEPYTFATGNITGTTVSAPVYDRTKSPHLFLGVAAVDIALDALNRALETENSTEAVERLARHSRSKAQCPTFELSPCELDSYRVATGGEETRCHLSVCSADDLVETIATQCTDSSKYPPYLIANTENDGLSYPERTCCANENMTSDSNECGASDLSSDDGLLFKDRLSSDAIVAISVICFFLALYAACYCYCCKILKSPEISYKLPPPVAPSAPPTTPKAPEVPSQ